MKRTTLFSVCSGLVAATVMSVAGYGCGDDDDAVSKPDTGTGTETSTSPEASTPETSTGNPAAPTLGAQIDRMGRPAVNTALNNAFEADDAKAGAAKNAYNANNTPSGWPTAFTPELAGNLAVYDGLDRTCGNQAAASADPAATTNVLKYGGLAGVLADDKLWLNTAGASTGSYLSVELDATGIAKNTDRGGRTLPMDVIDVTYSALAAGVLEGVTDGIAADPVKTSGTTFPYLAAPK
jgi:hypothetical protein